ncbi:DUF4223 family protein [Pseudomonas sp. B15(2017)]|uniref:DUF4223 family protein n=1 Tax=Pseudomonas sp. B15(2017) TaxID=1981744 RepID=UPI000A1EE957|nr:DUF4223 family protein [Pseudomonas sp. B15(2017)]
MRKSFKTPLIMTFVFCAALLTGCAGTVFNQEKNCSYEYLLHPAISVSKIIGGCGPVGKFTKE